MAPTLENKGRANPPKKGTSQSTPLNLLKIRQTVEKLCREMDQVLGPSATQVCMMLLILTGFVKAHHSRYHRRLSDAPTCTWRVWGIV